jgi:hypothetical protein
VIHEKLNKEIMPLCTFCNMLRHDEGFTLEAIHASSMYRNGKQVRHFPGCPMGIAASAEVSE